jgi:hypothetical protein
MVLRVSCQDGEKAIAALTAKGFKVKSQYVKDIRPFLPA